MGPKDPPRIRNSMPERTSTKRSILLKEHKTSVTLEDPFWVSLKEIAGAQGTPVSQLIAAIDSQRRERSTPIHRPQSACSCSNIIGSRMGEELCRNA